MREVRPLRAALSVALLAGALWFAFTVKLGPRTFAQHVDRIGRTPEAKQLMQGTRDRVRPVLDEASARVLGEYVEAPTRSRSRAPAGDARASKASSSSESTERASTSERAISRM